MTPASVTVLYAQRPPYRAAAVADGGALWLSRDELTAATGWELTREGLCEADRCIRIPHGREAELVRGTQVNVAALARLLDQPVVHDEAHAIWSFAEPAQARRAALRSLQARDFTLPALDGRRHSLADYRGKKVFLVSWASW